MTATTSAVWTILLPGPSLEHLELDEERCGPIVAVNSALLAPIRRVDYWSVADLPSSVQHPCRKHAAALRPTVVTYTGKKASAWERWFNLGLKTVAFDGRQPGGPEAFARARDLAFAVTFGRGPSMAMAILWAVLNGATRLDLYGCDLSGTGYAKFGGITIHDRMERSAQEWEGRWLEERSQMAHAIRAAHELGIEIRRVKAQ